MSRLKYSGYWLILLVLPFLLAYQVFEMAAWRPRVLHAGTPHLTHPMPVPIKMKAFSVAFAPNGNNLAMGREFPVSGRIKGTVWAAATGEIGLWDVSSQTLKHHYYVAPFNDLLGVSSMGGFSSLRFSANGERLLAADINGAIAMFNARTGKRLLLKSAITSNPKTYTTYLPIGFSRDGKSVFYSEQWRAGREQTDTEKVKQLIHRVDVVVCRASDGHFLQRFRLQLQKGEWPSHIKLSPNNKWLIIATRIGTTNTTYGQGGKLIVFDAQNGQRHRVLEKNFDRAEDVAVSPDNRMVALGCQSSMHDPDVPLRFYALQTGKPVEMNFGGVSASHVLFSPNSHFAAVADNHEIQLLDMKSAASVRTIKTQSEIWDFSFSPDGNQLAVANGREDIYLWRLH